MGKIIISMLLVNMLVLVGAESKYSGVACPLEFGYADLRKKEKLVPNEIKNDLSALSRDFAGLACNMPFKNSLSTINHVIPSSVYFERSQPSLVYKMTGKPGHLSSQLYSNGFDEKKVSDCKYREMKIAQLEKTEHDYGPILSYQTASRAFGYALLSQVIEKNKLTYIGAPKTYACRINQKNPSFDNKNCVIVQELIKGIHLDVYLRAGNKLSPVVIAQLTKAVIGAALWEPHRKNIIVSPERQKLYFVDLEWPNYLPSNNFFYSHPINGQKSYNHSIQCGIVDGLLSIFKGNNEAIKTIIKVVDEHPMINSQEFDAGYKKKLFNALKQYRG